MNDNDGVSGTDGPNFRALPSVERLAGHSLLAPFFRPIAVRAARQAIDEARERIRSGQVVEAEEVAERARVFADRAELPTLRRAVNATGVLLHTNLGRATLCKQAERAVAAVAGGHGTLETDEETGGRGSRQSHVRNLLCELTGAEDAFVVNNNAGATFLAVAALAANREVVLSRGQMVEIGGQFRLPDVIESAGARLVEVGTTNRTRISDYARVIGPDTAMLLRCHPSNFRIVGFTEEATLPELVALGRERSVCVADDIGSGALVNFAPYGLEGEPIASQSIADGAEIVWFSGDKLLGGPQSGILVGTRERLAPLKNHPLARALRPDKLTLAALEATLRVYQNGDPWRDIPILRRIARPADDILTACGRVARGLRAALGTNAPGIEIDIVAAHSEIGGGSLPGHGLPSWAVAVSHPDVTGLARHLRRAPVPVYGRIEKDRLLLDLRAVDEGEEPTIAQAFAQTANVSRDVLQG